MPDTIPQTCLPEPLRPRAGWPAAVEFMRQLPCTMCWAAGGTPCQREPAGDHLRRWIDAYEGGLVTSDDMAGVFGRVLVITPTCVVPEVTR